MDSRESGCEIGISHQRGSPPRAGDDPELVLETANRSLAELLATEPMTLQSGGRRALDDPLWVWGVVGGKEVGKTTLINALAGRDVADFGQVVGEGTTHPTAYLNNADLPKLQMRFEGAAISRIEYRADAPESMTSLVLVDLPDFDSQFADHVEQVRRIAGVLDGIIWVSTPKKMGDLRAIREIRGVLKDRTNFVYVVNKMDWLIAQGGGSALGEFDRAETALQRQIDECDPQATDARRFLVAAKCRSVDEVMAAIGRMRLAPAGSTVPRSAAGDTQARLTEPRHTELQAIAGRMMENFQRLRQTLTTPPTAEAREAAKRANLEFQTRVQARALLEHHQPEAILSRLERVTAEGEIEEIVETSISPEYVQRTVRALNPDRAVLAEWSGELFRRRISFWPVLGIIAWPVAALGSVISGIRSFLVPSMLTSKARPADSWHAAMFDADGITLADRVDAVLVATRRRLGDVPAPLVADLPEADVLERQCRSQVLALAESFRAQTLSPMLARRPGFLGRLFRRGLALLILLWFPFIQPVLHLLLGTIGRIADWNWRMAASLVVEALSASAVLSGLAVSLLLLACITAAVYSLAVRDANALLQRVTGSGDSGDGVCAALTATIRRPLENACERIKGVTGQLQRMAA